MKTSQRRKLLMITGTWPPMRCGVGDYTQALCRELIALGWEVHVFTATQAQITMPGVILHPDVQQWRWSTLAQLQRLVQSVQPEIINFQWPTARYGRSLAVNWIPWRLRKWFPTIPIVTTLHEVRYFKPWTRLRLLPSLAASHRVILVDPLDAAAVKALMPSVGPRCRVIPIGSNLPAVAKPFNRQEARRQLGFQRNDFVVTFFGFANRPKGLEDLLDALAVLRPTHPEIRFLWLSQLDDAYGQGLRQQLKKLGLETMTQTTDYASAAQTAARLACADCAVLPFTDGIALKRGSVMACLLQGLPLISTLPETPPFVQTANVLLVPPRQPQALAAAIRRMMQEPALRKSLSQASKVLAKSFAWDTIARQQQEIFMEARKDCQHAARV